MLRSRLFSELVGEAVDLAQLFPQARDNEKDLRQLARDLMVKSFTINGVEISAELKQAAAKYFENHTSLVKREIFRNEMLNFLKKQKWEQDAIEIFLREYSQKLIYG